MFTLVPPSPTFGQLLGTDVVADAGRMLTAVPACTGYCPSVITCSPGCSPSSTTVTLLLAKPATTGRLPTI